MNDFILNEMSHEKFQSDKNYRFFMVRIDKKIIVVLS